MFFAVPLSIAPDVGILLGGFPVRVAGPCFKNGRVLCRFNKTISSGVVATPINAFCVPPMFARVGVVPLSVSVDGGATFTSAADLKLGMTGELNTSHIYASISVCSIMVQPCCRYA